MIPSGPLSPEKRRLLATMLREKGIDASRMEPIPRADRSGPVPLTANQQGLWFDDQMDPGRANYNIPGAVRLKGRLVVPALERSLTAIVRRHESLRTTFSTSPDGVPCQVIAPPGPLDLPVIDLEGRPPVEREAEALRLATEEARRAFDLARGPLFRAFLVRLADDEYVLVLNIHHIVCDGWSMGVFTRELAALYEASCLGKPSPLAELPIQVADVAIWERDWNKGPEAAARLAYWKQRLGDHPPVLQMPTDRPRPAVQSMRGGQQPLALSKSLSDELRALSRREGVTLYVTLHAAFDALLHHYTGQHDLVVGTGIANRSRLELEELIGFFVTVLPLRIDLSGSPTFREMLGRVRAEALGATAHPLSLGTLVRALALQRDPSRSPLFQVELTLLTPDRNPALYGYGLPVKESLTLPGLTLTTVNVEYNVARFDLAVFVWDMPEGLMGTVEYSKDLFEPATVARIVSGLESVLRHVVVHPDLRLDALSERLREDAHRGPAGAAPAQSVQGRMKSARRQAIKVDRPS